MCFWKSKKNDARKKEKHSDEELKNEYEKISHIIFKLNKILWPLIFFSMIIFLYLILFGIIYLFYNKDISLQYVIFSTFWAGIILIVASGLIAFISLFYEEYKKYDTDRIIRIYFSELIKTSNPEDEEKIIKHIFYNISRVSNDFGGVSRGILTSYLLKDYEKFLFRRENVYSDIVKKCLEFIKDCLIYLNKKDYLDIFKKLGYAFEDEDYKEILHLSNNKNLIKKINENKNYCKIHKYERVRNILFAIKENKELISLFIFILLLILYFLGIIAFPTYSP